MEPVGKFVEVLDTGQGLVSVLETACRLAESCPRENVATVCHLLEAAAMALLDHGPDRWASDPVVAEFVEKAAGLCLTVLEGSEAPTVQDAALETLCMFVQQQADPRVRTDVRARLASIGTMPVPAQEKPPTTPRDDAVSATAGLLHSVLQPRAHVRTNKQLVTYVIGVKCHGLRRLVEIGHNEDVLGHLCQLVGLISGLEMALGGRQLRVLGEMVVRLLDHASQQGTSAQEAEEYLQGVQEAMRVLERAGAADSFTVRARAMVVARLLPVVATQQRTQPKGLVEWTLCLLEGLIEGADDVGPDDHEMAKGKLLDLQGSTDVSASAVVLQLLSSDTMVDTMLQWLARLLAQAKEAETRSTTPPESVAAEVVDETEGDMFGSMFVEPGAAQVEEVTPTGEQRDLPCRLVALLSAAADRGLLAGCWDSDRAADQLCQVIAALAACPKGVAGPLRTPLMDLLKTMMAREGFAAKLQRGLFGVQGDMSTRANGPEELLVLGYGMLGGVDGVRAELVLDQWKRLVSTLAANSADGGPGACLSYVQLLLFCYHLLGPDDRAALVAHTVNNLVQASQGEHLGRVVPVALCQLVQLVQYLLVHGTAPTDTVAAAQRILQGTQPYQPHPPALLRHAKCFTREGVQGSVWRLVAPSSSTVQGEVLANAGVDVGSLHDALARCMAAGCSLDTDSTADLLQVALCVEVCWELAGALQGHHLLASQDAAATLPGTDGPGALLVLHGWLQAGNMTPWSSDQLAALCSLIDTQVAGLADKTSGMLQMRRIACAYCMVQVLQLLMDLQKQAGATDEETALLFQPASARLMALAEAVAAANREVGARIAGDTGHAMQLVDLARRAGLPSVTVATLASKLGVTVSKYVEWMDPPEAILRSYGVPEDLRMLVEEEEEDGSEGEGEGDDDQGETEDTDGDSSPAKLFSQLVAGSLLAAVAPSAGAHGALALHCMRASLETYGDFFCIEDERCLAAAQAPTLAVLLTEWPMVEHATRTLLEDAVGDEAGLDERLVAYARLDAVAAMLAAMGKHGAAAPEAVTLVSAECVRMLREVELDQAQVLVDYFTAEGRAHAGSLASMLADALVNVHTERANEQVLGWFSQAISGPYGQVLAQQLQSELRGRKDTLALWVERKLLGWVDQAGEGHAAGPQVQELCRGLVLGLSSKGPAMAQTLQDVVLGLLPVAWDQWPQQLHVLRDTAQQLAAQLGSLDGLLAAMERGIEWLGQQPDTRRMESAGQLLEWLSQLLYALGRLDGKQPAPAGQDVAPVRTRAGDAHDAEKEEEELAKTLCTFNRTGKNFEHQHWYFCHTCGLVNTEGCCAVCARVCHRGHDVTYARYSRFFCDCAAGAQAKKCISQVPREYRATPQDRQEEAAQQATKAQSQPAPADQPATSFAGMSESQLREAQGVLKRHGTIAALHKLYTVLSDQVAKDPVPGAALRHTRLPPDARSIDQMMVLKSSSRPNTFDGVRLKYSGEAGRLAKDAIANGTVVRSVACSVPVGSNIHQLVVGNGEKVEVVGMGAGDLPSSPAGQLDRKKAFSQCMALTVGLQMEILSKNATGFEVLSVQANSTALQYVAVCGARECHVLTLSPKGTVADQLAVGLDLDQLGPNLCIVKALWLPGSQVELAVATNQFVKIYDLSKDVLSPTFYFSLLDGAVKDVAFGLHGTMGMHMYLLSTTGVLYVQHLESARGCDGAYLLTNAVPLDRSPPSQPTAVTFSEAMGSLLVAYSTGEVDLLELNSTLSDMASKRALVPASTAAKTGPVSMLVECSALPGLLVAVCPTAGFVLVLGVGPDYAHCQAIKVPGSSSIQGAVLVDGHSGSRTHPLLLVVLEDGSIHICEAVPALCALLPTAKLSKKSAPAHAAKLKSLFASGEPPVDFYEHVECITKDMAIGGDDVLQNYSAQQAVKRLASPKEYIVGPTRGPFSMVVKNMSPAMTIVAVRILLGAHSLDHLPSELQIMGRTIPVREGMQRWYQVPFTLQEALGAEKEVAITVGAPFNRNNAPIVDSIEVYGLPKDVVAWLDGGENTGLEAVHGLGGRDGALLSCVDCLLALRLASADSQGEAWDHIRASLPDMLLLPLSPPVRAKAKALLRALCPSASAYYEAKDSTALPRMVDFMRSLLAAKSSPGPLEAATYEQYVAIVAKVASKRPSNLLKLLEQYPDFVEWVAGSYWVLRDRPGGAGFHEEDTVIGSITATLLAHLAGLLAPSAAPGPRVEATASHLVRFLVASDVAVQHGCSQAIQAWANAATEDAAAVAGAAAGSSVPVDEDDEEAMLQLALAMSLQTDPAPANQNMAGHGKVAGYLATRLVGEFGLLESLPASRAVPFLQGVYWAMAVLEKGEHCTQAIDQLVRACARLLAFPSGVASMAKGSRGPEGLLVLVFLLEALTQSPAVVAASSQSGEAKAKGRDKDKDKDRAPRTPGKLPDYVWRKVRDGLIRQGAGSWMHTMLQSLLAHWASVTEVDDEPAAPVPASLLKPKRGVEYNMWPFFSDHYAHKHAGNLLENYPAILTDSLLRLGSSFNRKLPISKPDSTANMAGWRKLLCEYITLPQASFAKKACKRLLLYISDSKATYYEVRDDHVFDRALLTVKQVVAMHRDAQPLSYAQSVELVTRLEKALEVAHLRPANWQGYCQRHPDTLVALFGVAPAMAEDNLAVATRLITQALTVPGTDQQRQSNSKSKSASGPAAVRQPPRSFMELVTGQTETRPPAPAKSSGSPPVASTPSQLLEHLREFIKGQGSGPSLASFAQGFLLRATQASTRQEAKQVIMQLWLRSGPDDKRLLVEQLWPLWKQISQHGKKGHEMAELFCQISMQLEGGPGLVVGDAVAMLQQLGRALLNHPNAYVYDMLAGLVDLDGYYLEAQPCMVCNSAEPTFGPVKLDTMRVEQKFTDSTHLVKFTSPFVIQALSVRITDTRRARMVKTINLYYNDKSVQDLGELKNRWALWRKAKTVTLSPQQGSAEVEFAIPITATNLLIEYASFYESVQATAAERLQCPRCSRSVTDRHGICRNCGENAHQCHHCRNINYENLRAFLCNECGFCKFARFDYTLNAKPSFTAEPVESEEDAKKATALIDKQLENAQSKYQQLLAARRPLVQVLTSLKEPMKGGSGEGPFGSMGMLGGAKVGKKLGILSAMYSKECKATFEALSKSLLTASATSRELADYHRRMGTRPPQPQTCGPAEGSSNECYGCISASVHYCLMLLQAAAKAKDQASATDMARCVEALLPLLQLGPGPIATQARQLICRLATDNGRTSKQVLGWIQGRMDGVLCYPHSTDMVHSLRSDMALLADLAALPDTQWEPRLRMVLGSLMAVVQDRVSSPAVAEVVLVPLMRIVNRLCKPPPTVKPTPAKSYIAPAHQELGLPVSYQAWQAGSHAHSFEAWRASQPRAEGKAGAGEGAAQAGTEASRELQLMGKYFRRWHTKTVHKSRGPTELGQLDEGAWLRPLVFSAGSSSLRQEACGLIERLAKGPARTAQFLVLLAAWLPDVARVGGVAAEYVAMLDRMLAVESSRLFLTVRGLPEQLCRLIGAEVERFEQWEGAGMAPNLAQGYALKTYIQLLDKCLEGATVQQWFKARQLVGGVLSAYLSLRSLMLQRTRLTDESEQLLKALLGRLTTGTDKETQAFMAACVQLLKKYSSGPIPVFILEQLLNIVAPPKQVPEFLLVLEKSHTQEEYIRGRMTKNPYSSKELGPSMRHVKNKICTDLELLGLLEDDFAMELLVADKIVKLDVPVQLVYEQVWKPHVMQQQGGGPQAEDNLPPMVVIYRLQGLDGEATEEIVESLEEIAAEDVDAEEKYRVTAVMAECGGLKLLLGRLAEMRQFDKEKEKVLLLLQLLGCCMIKSNIRTMLGPGYNAVGTLLSTLTAALGQDADIAIAHSLLLNVEHLLEAANMDDATEPPKGAASQLAVVLDKLAVPAVLASAKLCRAMARILPFLTYGEASSVQLLVDHFEPHVAFTRGEGATSTVDLLQLGCFSQMLLSMPANSLGAGLKDHMLARGLPQAVLAYIARHIPEGDDYESEPWMAFLALPALPLLLKCLTGFCSKHPASQQALHQAGMVALVHRLEHMPSAKQIGSLAENLLEVLDDAAIQAAVEDARSATRRAKRELALAKRQQMLKDMGFQITGQAQAAKEARIVAAGPVEGMEQLTEEKGHVCMICREGYGFKGDEVLGIYTFSKCVDTAPGESRREKLYTTVTHFNMVHVNCHKEAARADRSRPGRQARGEWDGATLRNSQTKCNNLFPMIGPSVRTNVYSGAVDKYFSTLGNLARVDTPRFRLLVHDLRLLLTKYAWEQSFSGDSLGGGRDSNIGLVAYMVQMGLFLLDQRGPSQRPLYDRTLSAFLAEPEDTWLQAANQVDGVFYMMVLSLFVESAADWQAHALTYLKRALLVMHARAVPPTAGNRLASAEAQPYETYKPALVFWALLRDFQKLLKETPGSHSGEAPPEGEAQWVADMHNLLRYDDLPVLERATQVLSTYEQDYLTAESLDEFLDAAGVLPLVLQEAPSAADWLATLLRSMAAPPAQ